MVSKESRKNSVPETVTIHLENFWWCGKPVNHKKGRPLWQHIFFFNNNIAHTVNNYKGVDRWVPDSCLCALQLPLPSPLLLDENSFFFNQNVPMFSSFNLVPTLNSNPIINFMFPYPYQTPSITPLMQLSKWRSLFHKYLRHNNLPDSKQFMLVTSPTTKIVTSKSNKGPTAFIKYRWMHNCMKVNSEVCQAKIKSICSFRWLLICPKINTMKMQITWLCMIWNKVRRVAA